MDYNGLFGAANLNPPAFGGENVNYSPDQSHLNNNANQDLEDPYDDLDDDDDDPI